jgi:hypothetical protein
VSGWTVLAAAFCTVPAAGFATAPTGGVDAAAAALLALHRTYVGWSGNDGSFPTLREVGALMHGDRLVARLALLRRGGVYRRSVGGREDGFTGRVAWCYVGGFTVPVTGAGARAMATEDLVTGELLEPVTAQVVREETIDGVATSEVHVEPQVGVPVDLWIDRGTGAYERIVYDPGGAYERRLDVVGYADAAPGKRVLAAWHDEGLRPFGHGDPAQATWTYTAFDTRPIADAALHPPTTSSTWTFDPAHAPFRWS